MNISTVELFPFDNTYARLPEHFYARLAPTPVKDPRLIKINVALAQHLGLDPERLATPEGIAVLAGNSVPVNADPLAMTYAGHQFAGFVPQLGDGRAILLGEVIDADGLRRDVHLKGAGPTPFSRRGDGRAALGPVLREYIVSEAMAALGIPTTRALAAVTTGEWVMREEPLPGAVLARVAASHIRVGTFQFFAARNDAEGLMALADHVIARHYPAAAQAENPARALLDGVILRQAVLIARWMMVGFIHGVMNTDNMTVSGETIDYGPCAFMDAYHPGTIYSAIDRGRRYAFENQPGIAHWNLARFSETLLPLLADHKDAAIKEAEDALGAFPDHFKNAYATMFRQKLGLRHAREGDETLAQDLLDRMDANNADFTLTFRGLSQAAANSAYDGEVAKLFSDPSALNEWLPLWRARIADEGGDDDARSMSMQAVNPGFIPRNHLVAEVITAATQNDYAPFERLLAVLARPYSDQPDAHRYTLSPQAHEVVHQTFCGT
jgi:serine/tyrosine/threonine adenylyltransferase